MKRSTAFLALLLAGTMAMPSFAQDEVMTAGSGAGVDAAARGDFEAAVSFWRPMADRGDADAQYNMAQAYKFGRGVPTDLSAAERYYGMAARQGHWRAADNYGLLLFHRGAKAEAMPYLEQAAGRGDARAQYLYGLALFNGDLAPKDWVRAYALMTLATNAGLDQATRARAQMDEYIPLEERRRGVALSSQIAQQAQKNREQQAAAADYGIGTPQVAAATPAPAPATRAPAPVTRVPSSPSRAGADYAPAPTQRAQAVAPPPAVRTDPAPRRVTPPPRQPAAMTGPWKIQLGAFSVASGADRLWASLSSHPALAGAQKVVEPGNGVTRLKAGGFASRAAAQAACNRLKSSGQDCLVTR